MSPIRFYQTFCHSIEFVDYFVLNRFDRIFCHSIDAVDHFVAQSISFNLSIFFSPNRFCRIFCHLFDVVDQFLLIFFDSFDFVKYFVTQLVLSIFLSLNKFYQTIWDLFEFLSKFNSNEFVGYFAAQSILSNILSFNRFSLSHFDKSILCQIHSFNIVEHIVTHHSILYQTFF